MHKIAQICLIFCSIYAICRSDDCDEKCQCYEEIIFCSGIHFSPLFSQQRCSSVMDITIAASIITDLSFSKCFNNLNKLTLSVDTVVNCTYVQKFIFSGINFEIEAKRCDGMINPWSKINIASSISPSDDTNESKGRERTTFLFTENYHLTTVAKKLSSFSDTVETEHITTTEEFISTTTKKIMTKEKRTFKGNHLFIIYSLFAIFHVTILSLYYLLLRYNRYITTIKTIYII